MRELNTRDYHLAELRVARDPKSAHHTLPELPRGCQAVLDIGCGAGQSLLGMRVPDGVLSCGVDLDETALELGKELTNTVCFIAATGEVLPFKAASFELVFSRVALPYTEIPVVLSEVARVLKPGGRVWLTLHKPRVALQTIGSGLRRRSLRAAVYGIYVLLNGFLLHVGVQQLKWPFGRRRYESVQTRNGIQRALSRAGFVNVEVTVTRFFTVVAQKPEH